MDLKVSFRLISVFIGLGFVSLQGISAQCTTTRFTVQPTNAIVGNVISPAVKVAATDGSGNTIQNASSPVPPGFTVSLGNNPGGGTLSGTKTVAMVNGVATFSDLRIDKPGVGYTLVVSGAYLYTSNQGILTVVPACPITSQPFNITAVPTTTTTTTTTSTSTTSTTTSSTSTTTTTIPELLTLHFAQFGNGGGIGSDIVLANPSATASAAVKVDWLDDDGLPFALSIAGVSRTAVEATIAPLDAVTISTDGLGRIISGSARVVTAHPVGGVIRFSLPGVGIAGVGESLALTGFITPVRRKLGGVNTGVAMRNVETRSISVTLSLQNKQGLPVGDAAVSTLVGGGHLARFIDELFPAVDTSNFEGTLVVRSGQGRIAATVLELGTRPGEFTTLPVTPLR